MGNAFPYFVKFEFKLPTSTWKRSTFYRVYEIKNI